MRPRKSKPSSSARAYALWLLGRRAYTVSRLQARLEQRGYSPDESRDAVGYLCEIGYLNDQAYADDFVQSRAFSGHGPRQISWELRSRGVEVETVNRALADLDAGQQKEQAMRVAVRRWGRSDSGDPKARQRVFRYLLQRGYDYDLVAEVINELMASLDSDG